MLSSQQNAYRYNNNIYSFFLFNEDNMYVPKHVRKIFRVWNKLRHLWCIRVFESEILKIFEFDSIRNLLKSTTNLSFLKNMKHCKIMQEILSLN